MDIILIIDGWSKHTSLKKKKKKKEIKKERYKKNSDTKGKKTYKHKHTNINRQAAHFLR